MAQQLTALQKSSNKLGIFSWCLFDWANSSFPAIITTFVFATYFTEKVAKNKIIGTEQWGLAVAAAGIIIAILSPILGAIADHHGQRKPWIGFFTLLCILSSTLLFYAKPSPEYVSWAISFFILGTIGLEVGMVFYNAMLNDIAPEGYVGRISGWSWGLGYFGGLTSLVIALVVFVKGNPAWLGLDTQSLEQIRICGPLVAVWFALFSLPFFMFTLDTPASGQSMVKSVSKGLKQLYSTIKSLDQFKEIVKFLVARILYIDGLNTIFAFGGIYAAGTFHMDFTEILEFGIVLNIGAGIGAMLFAWMDDLRGSKITIQVTLVIMICTAVGMLLVQSKLWFWLLGIVLSLGVGPVQSASRSLMVRLAPPHKMAEMFGLYAFSGKATAFIGPWLLGLTTAIFHSQRVGMSTVVIFLVSGLIILNFVKTDY